MLNTIVSEVKCLFPSTMIYADLPGFRAGNNPPSTLPPNVSVSTARPDIVIQDDRVLKILELTVCSSTPRGFSEAKKRKRNKPAYMQLISDLETKGFKVNYTTIEIGALGHYSFDATSSIKSLLPDIHAAQVKRLLTKLGKTSVACSFHIFNARNSTVWPENKPLYVS